MHNDLSNTDNFQFSYLPEQVATYFKDALGCFHDDHRHAFAAMCRLTVQATINDLGDSARLKLFDIVKEIAEIAEVDDRTYRAVHDILFDADSSSLYQAGTIDRETAAVLLETVKDILHQCYIRRAVLRQKLKMRRFFASQSDSDTPGTPGVSPFKRPTGTG
ncbi:MAG: hypothetical protein CL799_03955 [Chromatiales bacterium]|jgi:hypothetical protein|nr:hypothetical protein [Chromatiales bacterium]MDP6149597.1 hypothetical protein [Gammaproteobacteria bacterium]MDP7271090.1 hypothetical protein [Gammaproteobacteria bacterium]HJP04425.1 hypothetical protein [Gammaproteobacteria bacterium]